MPAQKTANGGTKTEPTFADAFAESEETAATPRKTGPRAGAVVTIDSKVVEKFSAVFGRGNAVTFRTIKGQPIPLETTDKGNPRLSRSEDRAFAHYMLEHALVAATALGTEEKPKTARQTIENIDGNAVIRYQLTHGRKMTAPAETTTAETPAAN